MNRKRIESIAYTFAAMAGLCFASGILILSGGASNATSRRDS